MKVILRAPAFVLMIPMLGLTFVLCLLALAVIFATAWLAEAATGEKFLP